MWLRSTEIKVLRPTASLSESDGRMHECFPPIAGRKAEVLILGSLPGRRSLELQQYYGHPHNSFWKILGAVLGEDLSVPYARRIAVLKRHRIAVWDVLAAAERPGSLDSSIVHASAAANDFRSFLANHRSLRRVYFNGRKAEEMYRRMVLPTLGDDFPTLEYRCLPSTSPAHAGLSFARKLAQWRAIRRA